MLVDHCLPSSTYIMRNLIFVMSFLTASISFVECFENESIINDNEALFLTKYIENNRLELAKTLSLVKHKELHWLTSYAGYLTVNKEYNSNMFFWFFPAKNYMINAPVVLWLNGGPGVSSLYGLFQENGPFFVNSEKKLEPREYSWHIDHNVIYIDNPIGTGFSFTESDSGYATNQIDVGWCQFAGGNQAILYIVCRVENKQILYKRRKLRWKVCPGSRFCYSTKQSKFESNGSNKSARISHRKWIY